MAGRTVTARLEHFAEFRSEVERKQRAFARWHRLVPEDVPGGQKGQRKAYRRVVRRHIQPQRRVCERAAFGIPPLRFLLSGVRSHTLFKLWSRKRVGCPGKQSVGTRQCGTLVHRCGNLPPYLVSENSRGACGLLRDLRHDSGGDGGTGGGSCPHVGGERGEAYQDFVRPPTDYGRRGAHSSAIRQANLASGCRADG